MKKQTPTNEQLDALGNFAANEGRTWKAALRHAWETGDYPTGSDSASLQQVRNAFGPGWLIGFKVRPVGSKYTASDMGCALGVIAEMEQPAPELPAPFLVMDDSDDSAHGTFETWGEARGCIAYDHLSKWTIYRAGQIVERSATA